jgi:hypothetical protein
VGAGEFFGSYISDLDNSQWPTSKVRVHISNNMARERLYTERSKED